MELFGSLFMLRITNITTEVNFGCCLTSAELHVLMSPYYWTMCTEVGRCI